MKKLLIVLGAAVVSGLSVYATLEWMDRLDLDVNGKVRVDVNAFVAMITAIGVLSACLALGFDRLVSRADQAITAPLEERLARLEAERRPSP